MNVDSQNEETNSQSETKHEIEEIIEILGNKIVEYRCITNDDEYDDLLRELGFGSCLIDRCSDMDTDES